jgi:hypothetical protein
MSPQNTFKDWARLLYYLSQNTLSLIGVVLTTSSAITLFGFWMYDFMLPGPPHPYVGILLFLILPGVFVLGLILIPVGIEEFIDAPLVKHQRQPSTTCAGMSDIALFATAQYQVLYALLAGCGPLRAGEALGLEIGKHISEDFRTLYIVQKAKRGEIQPYLKTKAGTREVDLCSQLANMLRDFVGERPAELLFHSSTGAQLLQSNTLRDSLHPILDYLAHERGGFNIFRRFRLTHLEKSDCPEPLKHFWSGHAPKHVSERYVKLTQERDFRLMWAEKIGLGFELPGAKVGQLGQLLQFRKAV